MAHFVLFSYLAEEHRNLWLALSKVSFFGFFVCFLTYIMCNYYHFYEGLQDRILWLLWSFSFFLSGVCREFVEAVSQYQPDMLKKQKVHLLLHLVECMEQFGPTSAFNSERYGFETMIGKIKCTIITITKPNYRRFETFNSFIRAQNIIYGNKHAPSRDIAHKFAVIEQIRYICEDRYLSSDKRWSIVTFMYEVNNYTYCAYKFKSDVWICRCGADLKMLFSSPILQHFLNCTPMCEAHSEKAIYQPGAVRKVRELNCLHTVANLLVLT